MNIEIDFEQIEYDALEETKRFFLESYTHLVDIGSLKLEAKNYAVKYQKVIDKQNKGLTGQSEIDVIAEMKKNLSSICKEIDKYEPSTGYVYNSQSQMSKVVSNYFKLYFYNLYAAKVIRQLDNSINGLNYNNTSPTYIGLLIYALELDNLRVISHLKPREKAKFLCGVFNLDPEQMETLRKAISSPNGKVSKNAVKYLKSKLSAYQIDLKNTPLSRFLPK